VTSRASSFHYKGRDVEPRAAARELGVQAVLTGRVERRGDEVFLGAELVGAHDDRQIWGSRYDGKLSDLMATQGLLVHDIANAIHAKLARPPFWRRRREARLFAPTPVSPRSSRG
jgi:adenylate cyclase